MKFIKLNNGVEMPMQGIGTFLLSPDEAEASATYALKTDVSLLIQQMHIATKKQ